VAACRASPTAAADELYPDPDWQPLSTALRAEGIGSTLVAWDDAAIEWADFDAVVIQSTWDSVDRPAEYLAWADHVGAVTVLMNPAPVVRWNLDKRYLRELEEMGVPVVPTRWLPPGTELAAGDVEFVVKPAISAGGRDTARYGAGDLVPARAHVGALHGQGRTVMVQDYMTAVDTEGEVKVTFIGGRFSHAIRLGPLLERGAGVVDRLWEKPRWIASVADPSERQIEAAQQTFDTVRGHLGSPLPYGRVDLVAGPDGEPLVIEVELIDPSLSLASVPPAGPRLARAISAHLAEHRRT
jgi:hypothetical protein